MANINPIRYRGYYYDTETGWYYLNSRYYDPGVKRFLNADSIVGANGNFTGMNLFAYCNNNPVMGYDPSGMVCLINSGGGSGPQCPFDFFGKCLIHKTSVCCAPDQILIPPKSPTPSVPSAPPTPPAPPPPPSPPAKVPPIPEGKYGDGLNCDCDTHKGKHNGQDIRGVPEGTIIQASATGVVADNRFSKSYGNVIVIDYGENTYGLYAHMNSRSSLSVGTSVSAGSTIGYVGNTGQSFGAHLHWGMAQFPNTPSSVYGSMCLNNNWIDPLGWLNS